MTSFVDEIIIRSLLREYHPHLTKKQLFDASHAIAKEIEVITYDRVRSWHESPNIGVVRIWSCCNTRQKR